MDQAAVTVALVEDEPKVFASVVGAIRADRRLRLVHACTTAMDMMRWLAKNSVDVLLVDLGLPDRPGTDVIALCRSLQPSCEIMVLSIFGDAMHMVQAFEAGARGYLLKDADKDELVRAIVAVERGEAIFSPAIAQRMIQYFTGSTAGHSHAKKGGSDEFAELTERELEILDLIARGQNNSTIAIRLSLSIKTVQNYVSSILTKLQVADRAQAIVRAREAGFGKK